jgi:hypothetical protein
MLMIPSQATGVGDVNEVIQKFVTQKDTEKNLMNMTREAQVQAYAHASCITVRACMLLQPCV